MNSPIRFLGFSVLGLIGVLGAALGGACGRSEPEQSGPSGAMRQPPGAGGPSQEAGPSSSGDDGSAAAQNPTSGVSDAATDVQSLALFGAAMSRAYCQRTKDCCAAYDGGTQPFDLSVCEGLIGGGGWENAGSGLAQASASNVAYDPKKAAECLAAIYNPAANKYTCPVIGSAEYSSITDTCYAAVTGKLAAGAVCTVDLECQAGNYCASADGGRVCAPLLAVAATCTRDAECSYRGKGAFCTRTNGCRPPLARGASCVTNVQCASGLCDENQTCNTQQTITASYNCDGYEPADAGTN
jgi:hypothetical protein